MRSLSKKTRFEIFKRDFFTCQYCGKTPPNIILHVDHIHPVSKGGDNSEDNLVTSCIDCNLGKSKNLLSSCPQSLSDKAKQIKESEEQLMAYYEIIQGKKDRLENEIWAIAKILIGNEDSMDRKWYASIKRFLGILDFYDVYESMEIAVNRLPFYKKKAFLYFCGICWNKIREAQNEKENN